MPKPETLIRTQTRIQSLNPKPWNKTPKQATTNKIQAHTRQTKASGALGPMGQNLWDGIKGK